MEIKDFLVMLQYEVQKSFDFVDATKGIKDSEASVLHIALEKVEVELPVTFSSKEIVYKPAESTHFSPAVKRLKLPYHEKTVIDKLYLPRKELKGSSINVEIIGPNESIDEKYSSELIGRIKVTMKPILK
jgi:hypothetical protein